MWLLLFTTIFLILELQGSEIIWFGHYAMLELLLFIITLYCLGVFHWPLVVHRAPAMSNTIVHYPIHTNARTLIIAKQKVAGSSNNNLKLYCNNNAISLSLCCLPTPNQNMCNFVLFSSICICLCGSSLTSTHRRVCWYTLAKEQYLLSLLLYKMCTKIY